MVDLCGGFRAFPSNTGYKVEEFISDGTLVQRRAPFVRMFTPMGNLA